MCGVVAAATTPHTDVFQLTILTTVTLARTNNALPDDGVTAPKRVGRCLNVNFNVNFKTVFKTIHLCISWLTLNLPAPTTVGARINP